MSLNSIVLMVVLIAIFFYVVRIFNSLVSLKNRYQNAFAQIDVQLKRRHDLIPNLVEATKAYLTHERETLERVISARNDAAMLLNVAATNPSDPSAIRRLSVGEGLLQQALGKLNVTVEAYPDLKANQNIANLTEELASTENRVAFARQAFNDGVTEYNTYRQSFPQFFLAPLFGHHNDAAMLEFEDSVAMQKPPKVSL